MKRLLPPCPGVTGVVSALSDVISELLPACAALSKQEITAEKLALTWFASAIVLLTNVLGTVQGTPACARDAKRETKKTIKMRIMPSLQNTGTLNTVPPALNTKHPWTVFPPTVPLGQLPAPALAVVFPNPTCPADTVGVAAVAICAVPVICPGMIILSYPTCEMVAEEIESAEHDAWHAFIPTIPCVA